MKRVLSAAVLVGLLTATVWLLPPWASVALAALLALLASIELADLAARLGVTVPPVFVAASSALCCAAFVLPDTPDVYIGPDALQALLLAAVVSTGLLALASGPPGRDTFMRPAIVMLAITYVSLPLAAAAWVRVTVGPAALTWLVAVIALSDTAQYYTGRLAGRRKLAPVVSPAKTVEGALGGVIAGSIAGGVLTDACLPGVEPILGAAIAFLMAGFGIAGDLFESLLKRSAGVKDSSQLIPGHGGVLDRIDSYLFAAPVLYLILRYIA